MKFQINLINDSGTLDIRDYIVSDISDVFAVERNLDFTIVLSEIDLIFAKDIIRIINISDLRGSVIEILINNRFGFLGKIYDLPAYNSDNNTYKVKVVHYFKEYETERAEFKKTNKVKIWEHVDYESGLAATRGTNTDEWVLASGSLDEEKIYSIKHKAGNAFSSVNYDGIWVTQAGSSGAYIRTYFEQDGNYCYFESSANPGVVINHGLHDNQQIILVDLIESTSIGGLTEGQMYYVYYVSEQFFGLRLTKDGAQFDFYNSKAGLIKYYMYYPDERELYIPVLMTGTTYKLKDKYTNRYLVSANSDTEIYIQEANTDEYNYAEGVFSIITFNQIIKSLFVGFGLNEPVYDFDISSYVISGITNFNNFDMIGIDLYRLYSVNNNFVVNPRLYNRVAGSAGIGDTYENATNWLDILNEIASNLGLVFYYRGNMTYGVSIKKQQTDFDAMDKIISDISRNRVMDITEEFKEISIEYYQINFGSGDAGWCADFKTEFETDVYFSSSIFTPPDPLEIDMASNFICGTNNGALGNVECLFFENKALKEVESTKYINYSISCGLKGLSSATSVYAPQIIEIDIQNESILITDAFAENNIILE